MTARSKKKNLEELFLGPVVVVSHCLQEEACRYNGEAIHDPVVAAMEKYVTFRPVCPEVAIGLGVPRDPIQLVAGKGGVTLVQPATGRDITQTMRGFAARWLDALGPLDGFLLKSRSPSCGISEVKVHSADGKRFTRSGLGVFAQAVLDRFPQAAVEEEGRLGDAASLDRFLTRIFASARLRQAGSTDGPPRRKGVEPYPAGLARLLKKQR